MGGLPSPTTLADLMLLHEDRLQANWEQWFALAGVDRVRSGRGPAYSHGSMAIEAAIRGEGLATGRSALVADDVAAGRLVAPFPQIQLKAERGYDLVYRNGNRDHPKVRVLCDWLAEEIRMFFCERHLKLVHQAFVSNGAPRW
jgi:LysR family glycine cleavage system transcriptional activator